MTEQHGGGGMGLHSYWQSVKYSQSITDEYYKQPSAVQIHSLKQQRVGLIMLGGQPPAVLYPARWGHSTTPLITHNQSVNGFWMPKCMMGNVSDASVEFLGVWENVLHVSLQVPHRLRDSQVHRRRRERKDPRPLTQTVAGRTPRSSVAWC